MSKIMSYWSSSDRFISLIFIQDPSMLLQMTGFHSFLWLSSTPLFNGRTDAEAEALILWSPDAKSQHIGKDSDAGKDWGQEEKGATKDEMIGWHHWLTGHEFEQTLGGSEGQGSLACCSPWGLRVGHDWATEQHKSSIIDIDVVQSHTHTHTHPPPTSSIIHPLWDISIVSISWLLLIML